MSGRVKAQPVRPGDVLRKEMIERRGITQDQLASALAVSRHSVSELVNNRRGITAEMALRLGRVLSTDPHFWLNLQRDIDLHEAEQRLGEDLQALDVLRPES